MTRIGSLICTDVACGGHVAEQHDAARPTSPAGCRSRAVGEVDQQRVVDARRRDGDDDRGDPQVVDEKRVDAAERDADGRPRAMRASAPAAMPYFAARVAARYCAAEAVAVNEMSIPPETSTTKTPAARIAVTE